jgi:hypothetical protein
VFVFNFVKNFQIKKKTSNEVTCLSA